MNETEKIFEEIKISLSLKSFREVASFYNLSHTSIYDMIRSDRLTIKMFKLIKTNMETKHINISVDYIIDKILLGL